MKNNHAQMVDAALKKRQGKVTIPAIAIDGDGTRKHDDFVSYDVIDGHTLVRMQHIVDMPEIISSDGDSLSKATELFERDIANNFLHSGLTKRFKVGTVIPVITFETRFDLRSGKEVGFKVYTSSIKFGALYTRFDIDCNYKDKDNLIVRATKLDPKLSRLLDRSSAQNFGEDFVRAILNQTNASALEWARQNGLQLIVQQNDVEGNIEYLLDDGKNPSITLKLTDPMRNWISLVNLSDISSVLNGRQALFIRSEKVGFIGTANSRKRGGHNKEFYKVFDGELDNFIDLIRERKFAAANVRLEQRPRLGFLAIDEISTNHYGFAEPLWEVSRVRDLHFSGCRNIYHMQIVLKREGEVLKTPVYSVAAPHIREAREVACASFWQQYFTDPNFTNPTWRTQPDLSFVKKQMETTAAQQDSLLRISNQRINGIRDFF